MAVIDNKTVLGLSVVKLCIIQNQLMLRVSLNDDIVLSEITWLINHFKTGYSSRGDTTCHCINKVYENAVSLSASMHCLCHMDGTKDNTELERWGRGTKQKQKDLRGRSRDEIERGGQRERRENKEEIREDREWHSVKEERKREGTEVWGRERETLHNTLQESVGQAA